MKKVKVNIDEIRKYNEITFSYGETNPDSTQIINGEFCSITNNKIKRTEYSGEVYVFPNIIKLFQSKIRQYL